MKINLVAVDENLQTIGLRRMHSYISTLNPDTTPYYIPLGSFRSLKQILSARYGRPMDDDNEVARMAEPIADADIVAFSSMTYMAEQTKTLIRHVRRINPRAYIMWGGIHPIMVPEDAIEHADAVCTGEGEFAFAELFEAFRNGRDYTQTKNWWFNRDGQVIRNGFLPLMTSEEMDTLPLPSYGRNEFVFDRGKQAYTPSTRWHYVDFMGLAYNTVWTIGCPFRCTYCGNTRFIDNDRAYAKLRHPSVRWVVNEIKAARNVHPHISCVVFNDDSFMALPRETIEEFATTFRQEVGLPFGVLGVIPNYVKRDKLEILLEAGLNHVRMGIQSGSKRILDFYKRPSPPQKILDAGAVLADYAPRYMMPPAYDIIVDNPIETREDVIETLELVYKLRRPFAMNMFSLRVLPNTHMAKQFEERGITAESIERMSYRKLAPTWANCLLALLICVRPPRWLFRRLLRPVKPIEEDQRLYPRLALILRLGVLIKRAGSYIRFMDFSAIPGRKTWLLQRIGLVKLWHRHMVPKFTRNTAVLREADPLASTPGGLHSISQ